MFEMGSPSCLYCECTDSRALVKCLECEGLFCNGKTATKGSHIIAHLVKRHHHSISLQPGSSLGETDIQCYKCGDSNVFKLGFMSAEENTVLVFLCRSPCAFDRSDKQLDWSTSRWQPLIVNFSLLPWIAEAPPVQDQAVVNMAIVDSKERRLESGKGDDISLQTLANDLPEIERPPILFESADEYRTYFEQLVKLEAQQEERVFAELSWTGVKVASTDARTVRFSLYGNDRLIVIGLIAILEPTNDFKAAKLEARVLLVSGGVITAEILTGGKDIDYEDTTFMVSFRPSQTIIQRTNYALQRFAKDKGAVSGYIRKCILGHTAVLDQPDQNKYDKRVSEIRVNGAQLNESQQLAVRTALSSRLLLVQGPPGTGKTVTSTALVEVLAAKCKVLVCAPSNIVVDQLTTLLGKTRLNVVRVVAASRGVVSPGIEHLTLFEKSRALLSKEFQVLLDDAEVAGKELPKSKEKKLRQAVADAEQRVLQDADVVCCTCVGAGDRRITKINFPTVLIDECTQGKEPECIIPITSRCRHLILVGDHQQLQPVVTDVTAAARGLSRSLFERLVELGHRPVRLTVQYRMHPSLSMFPSNMFYEGTLQNSASVRHMGTDNIDWLWVNEHTKMLFWASTGHEEIGPAGTSYLNQSEAANCRELVTRLIQSGVSPTDICIITPYEAQRTFMREHLQYMGELPKADYDSVEIESVDAFQGREKKYVILSCVRSNQGAGIGFLKDSRRLNVAITRAQRGLIVIGNPRVLCHDVLWRELLEFYQERRCLVQGTINNLRQYAYPLSRPLRNKPLPGDTIPGAVPFDGPLISS